MKRYKPKKYENPVKAIREMCIECMGGRDNNQVRTKLIAECSSTDCSLFSFRFGRNPYRRPTLSEEQRKRMADRTRKINLTRQLVGKRQPNLEDIG